jgi:hypothetical protein
MRIRTRLAAVAAIPALALGASLATATAASAAGPAVTGPFNYEVDTGGSWWLSNTPISEPGTGGGYADAGIVVDLGPLSGLTGITVTGSGPLSDNIWISNGSDEAAVPGGPHPLSAGVDFAYGFDQGNGTSFYMASGHFSGQTVSLATLQAYYTGDEAFAWVGLTNANGAATGHVLKVNGAPAAAYVKVTADGTASAR